MRPSRKSLTDLILHLHPPTVPATTLNGTLSFGLGGMAAMLTGLLFLTGVLLLLAYQPSTDQAYHSILVVTHEVPFGRWVRNIHHASANLLVVVAALHLLRVALTGAFGPGRRLNWMLGVLLFLVLLAANFTGYLLPWDQLAYWAVTICTSMLGYVPLWGAALQELFRGGSDIGQTTLANFFVLHITFFPALLLLLMFWHFWLIRRAGGLVRPATDTTEDRLPTVPHLLMREAAVGLGLVALVLFAAMVWDAPLLAQANPAMSPNPAKAPWYFQGFQELLLHLHPVFAVCVWPLLGGAALFALPFLPGSALPPGIWFGSPRARRLAIWSACAGLGITLGAILIDSLLLSTATVTDTWVLRGVLPTVFALALFTGFGVLLVKKYRYTRAEAVMACLIVALTALLVCTAVGIWFRGAQMRLVWPWGQAGGSV